MPIFHASICVVVSIPQGRLTSWLAKPRPARSNCVLRILVGTAGSFLRFEPPVRPVPFLAKIALDHA